MIKKSLIALITVAIIVLAGATFLDKAFIPTSEENRNITNTDTYSDLNIKNDKRDAIVRTFSRQQFEKFVKNDRMKIIEKTSGQTDGDIPNIDFSKSPRVSVTFYDKDKNIISVKNPKLDIYDTQFTLSNTGREFKISGGIHLEQDGDSYIIPLNSIESASKNNYGTLTLGITYGYNNNSYVSYTAVTYSKLNNKF